LAWIEWFPTLRLEVDRLAIPPLSVPLPMETPPSKNVTAPVAAEGEMVAVMVTICPGVDGFRLDARFKFVLVFVAVFIVCDTAGEVLTL